jgi:hypothetical protein
MYTQAVLSTLHSVTALACEDSGQTLETLHFKSSDILLRELRQVGLELTGEELERL